MSVTQNTSYAIVQVAHNFGAVAVVGGSLAALKFHSIGTRKNFVWLVLAGWATQAASGTAFGALTYYFDHHFPDISGIAVIALAIKMVCATSGILLLATYLFRGQYWPVEKMSVVWIISFVLGVTALSAAAFLRWFS